MQPPQEPDDAIRTPVVSFLGPVSSYTHQVLTLSVFMRPPWSFGLTDFDLAQAALSIDESDRYDYEPADTITGNVLLDLYAIWGVVSDIGAC